MKRLQRLLLSIVAVELVAAAVPIGLRLNSTRVTHPAVEDSNDDMTGRELLALPDRFLFDGAEKWQTLGEAYLVFGYFAKADACLHRASLADPESPESAFARGACLERLGKIDEAADCFRRAAERGKPQLAGMARYHLGRNHLRQEQPEAAVRAFESAGEDHFPSVYQRAKLLVRSGQADDAEPLLQRLADNLDNDLHVLQLRAQAAEQLDRADFAAEIRSAMDLASSPLMLDDTEVFQKPIRERFGLAREIARAEQQRLAGNPRGGAARLAGLADDDPRWEHSYLYLLQDAALAHLRINNPGAEETMAARRLLRRQLSERDFPTALAWELLGDVEFFEKHVDEARNAWILAERMQPGATVSLKLANVEQQRGNKTAAERHLALAGQFSGVELLRAGQVEEAEARLREGAAHDANLPNLWYYIGETDRFLGRLTEAEAAYRRCLKLNPDHGRALARIARLTKLPK